MNYPQISEYIESIKMSEDNFDQLKNLRPVLDEGGEPVMSSGNFAVVFKMKDIQTGKLHAVKCFLKEQEGRAEAYRMIAEELEHVNSTYLTPVKYYDRELFVDTNASDETEFPVLLMDWVEGETLDKFIIRIKYDGYTLSCLFRKFHELSKWLLVQPFAHGDLKPDNIIVTNDCSLVLIDYDGMYVPKMLGQNAREKGTPNYCNPYNRRDLNSLFSKNIDDFAIIHILLSLRVYSLIPRLITKDKDFALFNYQEFHNIFETSIYHDILSSCLDGKTCLLLVLFHKFISVGRISVKDWQLIDYEDSKRTFVNMEDMMCSLDNIVQAVNLAYSSMKYKDPARNEFEIARFSSMYKRIILATKIQKKLKDKNWSIEQCDIKYSRLKPNGIEKREGVVLCLEQYSLKFLFGLIKFKQLNSQNKKRIFGGWDDVFTEFYDYNKYESYLEDFVGIQNDYAQKYKFLYVFDIRNFFMSIDLKRLKDIYFDNDYCGVSQFVSALFDIAFNGNGLNPCSEVDFFFANLYLKSLDEYFENLNGVEYFRYCDDIRIFSNNGNLLDILQDTIGLRLSPLNLLVNNTKTCRIETENEKMEIAKACFVWSCRLYYSVDYENSKLVSKENLAEIIKKDLTSTYVFQLLSLINQRVDEWNGLGDHFDNLFYILKNVHKNATFYRMVIELILERGLGDGSIFLFEYSLRGLTDILQDDEVEPFVKYWILRTFFCTEKNYYKVYFEKDNEMMGQLGYPQICYTERLHDLIEKFRTKGSDKLLAHISAYIVNDICAFPTNTKDTNDLPF